MSKSVSAALAASQLLVSTEVFAQSGYRLAKSRPYTKKERDGCLKISSDTSSYLCASYPMTPEDQRPAPRPELAPDPTMPRFNQCLDTYRHVNNYALSKCSEELNRDLARRRNCINLATSACDTASANSVSDLETMPGVQSA